MKQHQYARIAHVFEKKYPEFFAEVVEAFKPQLSDTTIIQGLFTYYQSTQPRPQNNEDLFQLRLLFVASILDLFDPGSLYFRAVTSNRLASILANMFGFNHRQSLNGIRTQALIHIKNPRFKERVKVLSKELKTIASLGI